MYISLSISLSLYIYTYIHVCVYIYIYIHICITHILISCVELVFASGDVACRKHTITEHAIT